MPYVTLADWGELMTYVMRNYIKKDQGISFELAFSMQGNTGVLTREDDYTMEVDCTADTISFFDYDAFLRPDEGRVLIDLLEAATPDAGDSVRLFRRTDQSYERYGKEVLLDFAAYGIDFISDGKDCYVPIQTLSDFLLSMKYMNVYYNGEAIFFAKSDGFTALPEGVDYYEKRQSG